MTFPFPVFAATIVKFGLIPKTIGRSVTSLSVGDVVVGDVVVSLVVVGDVVVSLVVVGNPPAGTAIGIAVADAGADAVAGATGFLPKSPLNIL